MTTEIKSAPTVWVPEARRALRSVAYDGTAIVTPWTPGVRYVGPAQRAQADDHRRAVRSHLEEHGLARLRTARRAAA